MAESTILGNVIVFLDKIGVYEVVLPFLLVFTIVFAILEKSEILGKVKIGSETYTNKNINALVAFVVSFFVVASAQLVEIIAQVSAQVVILLLLSVFFLLLVGSFTLDPKEVQLKEGFLRNLFIGIMFVGIVLIFLNAIKTKSGVSWLDYSYRWLIANLSSAHVASVVFIIFIVLFIAFVIAEPKKAEKKQES